MCKMTSSSNVRYGSAWTEKLSRLGQRNKISSVAKFWDLLQGFRGLKVVNFRALSSKEGLLKMMKLTDYVSFISRSF